MTDTQPRQLDPAAIRGVVEEVLRRLAAQGGLASPAVAPAPAPAATTGAAAAPATAGIVAIPDGVVTLAHVERLPAGTREVTVTAKAVVTPSARDRAREAGVAIRRATSAAAAAAATRPFVIATADCRVDAAPRAATIARLVPQAQRLPTTGLADVLAALALHASRDAARGVLLTSRPAAAVVLANRSASLRAVTGRDAQAVGAAVAECAANLLVVDPGAFAGSLDRVCVDFATRAGGPLPDEFSRQPAGCGCKTHAH